MQNNFFLKQFWNIYVKPYFCIPILILIGLLCKGSTTDFDSVCLGSNPGNPTKTKKPQQIAEAFFMGGNESRGLGGLIRSKGSIRSMGSKG